MAILEASRLMFKACETAVQLFVFGGFVTCLGKNFLHSTQEGNYVGGSWYALRLASIRVYSSGPPHKALEYWNCGTRTLSELTPAERKGE